MGVERLNFDRFYRKPSEITPAIRSEFRRLTFPKQAKLIGCFAQDQMGLADKIISGSGLRQMPMAADIWLDIATKRPEPGKKEIDVLLEFQAIKGLYPQLAGFHEQVTKPFTDAVSFWVDNYYSCDVNGKLNTVSCLGSKARKFNELHMLTIDRESDMFFLGGYMKHYANFLARMFTDHLSGSREN
jgi:hypothetical protein